MSKLPAAAVTFSIGAICVTSLVNKFFRKQRNQSEDQNRSLQINNKSKDETQLESTIGDNITLLSEQEQQLVKQLLEDGQKHLFSDWPELGTDDESKQTLVAQLVRLHEQQHDGLVDYTSRARKLLLESQKGENPLKGYGVSVPKGEELDFGSSRMIEYECKGIQAAGQCAFVLVAGGLGERLGYSGIKIALPLDSARGACFLQVYCESIIALEQSCDQPPKGGCLPLVIMTSDDTHTQTQQLLRDNDNFGLKKGQITLLKQEQVACLSDNEAHIALKSPFVVQTKPHGHGDVHMLLYKSGLLQQWAKQGIQYVCFLQDTNGLVFHALPTAIGVSAENNMAMNSITIPRKAGEAIGGIMKLTKQIDSSSQADSSSNQNEGIVVNVEYNQIEALMQAQGGEGDVNGENGFSPYPGNVNQLVLNLHTYMQALKRTKGHIQEFINPKYTDDTKTTFKSSTRLECMMQDIAWSLRGLGEGSSSPNVGYTMFKQPWVYAPVKNAPSDGLKKVAAGGPSHTGTSGEMAVYRLHCEILKVAGARIGPPIPTVFNGLECELSPRVIWSPLWGIGIQQVMEQVAGGSVEISSNSCLVINKANIVIMALQLDGTLILSGHPDATYMIKNYKVTNAGYQWLPIENEAQPHTEVEKLKGFRVCKRDADGVHRGVVVERLEPRPFVLTSVASGGGDSDDEIEDQLVQELMVQEMGQVVEEETEDALQLSQVSGSVHR